MYSTYCESVLECYYIQPVYVCSVCITCDDLGLLHVQTVWHSLVCRSGELHDTSTNTSIRSSSKVLIGSPPYPVVYRCIALHCIPSLQVAESLTVHEPRLGCCYSHSKEVRSAWVSLSSRTSSQNILCPIPCWIRGHSSTCDFPRGGWRFDQCRLS